MIGSNNNRGVVLAPHQRGFTSGYIIYLRNLYIMRIMQKKRIMYNYLIELKYYVNLKLTLSTLRYKYYIKFLDVNIADILPGEMTEKYPYKKTDYSDNTKVARFFHPVVSTKNTYKLVENRTCYHGQEVEHVIRKVFQRVHVSFQYTSLRKISTVNYLNVCKT